MIARDLILFDLPLLKCSDTGQKAISIMESMHVSHLPIVRGKDYLGLISDKDIYDRELEMCELGMKMTTLPLPFVRANQHLYEIARIMLELKVTLMPVLEMNNEYLGSITLSAMSTAFIEMVSVKEPGALIVLALSPTDYTLSQIAQIVESNDAKVLSLYTKNPENSMEMEVTLKVNVTDISAIIQTFVRYDYNIKAVYMDDSLLKDMYNERYDLFMKYMNI